MEDREAKNDMAPNASSLLHLSLAGDVIQCDLKLHMLLLSNVDSPPERSDHMEPKSACWTTHKLLGLKVFLSPGTESALRTSRQDVR